MSNSNLNEREKNVIDTLAAISSSPLRLIKEGGKLGINSVKKFFPIVLSALFINLILVVIGVVRLVYKSNFSGSNIGFLGLIIVLAIMFVLYAVYRTYQYIKMDALCFVYNNMTSFFQKLCSMLVDKLESLYKKQEVVTGNQVQNIIDIAGLLSEHYGKVPSILRNGVAYILKKSPLITMAQEFRQEIVTGGKEGASKHLFTKLDSFIRETVFSGNNTRWVTWLLLINVIVQFVLIITIK